MRIFLLGVGLLALLSIAAIAGQTKVPTPQRLPAGWRNWTHITTGVIYSDKHPLFGAFGGVHHIYANRAAAEAYRKNANKFPDGSQIVFVLYEAKDENGMYVAGKKKVTALMVKDSKRYARSGGWGWQAWDATGKAIVTDPVGQCQGCHDQVKNRDRVFSRWTP
ncbi:MAG: cytochrome P460 family protein [Fimbriimonadales bacterium]|nr:cytochrome P460 family protein [Fimbriimonadales bacterium]